MAPGDVCRWGAGGADEGSQTGVGADDIRHGQGSGECPAEVFQDPRDIAIRCRGHVGQCSTDLVVGDASDDEALPCGQGEDIAAAFSGHRDGEGCPGMAEGLGGEEHM